MLGPDVVGETSDKIKIIQQRMKAAQDRQKSYADKRRRDLKFSVGDLVFVKISPLKSVIRLAGEANWHQDLLAHSLFLS